MRRAAAAFIVLVSITGVILAACGPVPERQWPIWTGGGTYDDPYSYHSPVN